MSNEGDWKRLVSKGTTNWTIGEVGMWCEFIGMPKYKLIFLENEISGEELLDLEEEDLRSLGLEILGHRKKMGKYIAKLRNGNATRESASSTSASSQSASETGSEHSYQSEDSENELKTTVKLYYNKDISRISVKKDITLDKFKLCISKEFGGKKMSFKIKDEDDDLIRVRTTSSLQNMLETLRPPIRVVVNRRRTKKTKKAREATFLSSAQEQVYLNLVDAVVIIDNEGSMKLANSAACTLFGYSQSYLKNKNVNILMPEPYCTQHDSYLSTYHDTKKSSIIGTSRTVMGKTKSGSTVNLRLSVTVHKNDNGEEVGFIGTLVPVKKSESSNANNWSGLDTLLEAAIVASPIGDIVYANRAAIQMFDTTKQDIVGTNLETLMPSPHSDNHRQYMNNYKLTGKKTVIGKTREVLAEKSDGTIFPVMLSVNEQDTSEGKFFTGVLKPMALANNRAKKSSALRQSRDVINSLCIPGIIISKGGSIQAFNQAASKLLGYNLNEVIGQNVSMICPPEHAENHDQYLANYLSTGVAKVIGKERILKAKHKNGNLTSIQLSVTETKAGNVHFFTGMLHAA